MDLRRGNFEASELIVRCDAGSYVVASGAEGESEIVFVPRDDDAARREQARLAEIAGPGVPRCDTHPSAEAGRVVVRLVGLGGAVPLHVAAPLTATQLRAALTRLVSALSHAHSRGWFHGRIAAPLILVDERTECWLVGWADARAVRHGVRNDAGLDDVSRDLRDVGMALLRHLLRAPPEAAGDLSDDEVEAAAIPIRADDPELARVLARLASADQRECYESATEVLTDLGERDESLPDAWAELPFVGRRSIVRLVMRRLDLAGGPEGGLASFELTGPAGSGRSRLLAEIGRAARDRGVAVLMLDGRSGTQPWGPLGDLARQLLARSPDDAPARLAPALTTILAACAASPADTLARTVGAPLETADSVAAALADLAHAALGGNRALVLLDDEDCLHPAARTAWRLLGSHVAGTTDTHQALRALLVSAASGPPSVRSAPYTDGAAPRPATRTAPPDDPGSRRETLAIEDLTRPRIHRLLTLILAEPGMAAALVDDIHELTGGRIAEVVEHLRLLAARGTLRPVGRRWRLHDPAAHLRAIAIPEATRRTLADAGPEAARIAELLAITPDMRLDRASLIELAEIPAHRFQSAVDSAERAGLILRTGAAWRLRTQTLRARIDAALSAERRRALHREILFRLLETEPRDLPAIATHARGAADPRAAEWTREAIAFLMSTRRHPEVIAHYEESRDLIDPAGIDTSLKLDYCESLLEVGRIGPAASGAREVLREPRVNSESAGRVMRILMGCARVSTNWRAALDVPLNDDCDDEDTRAECRLLRALANFRLSRRSAAERERRLARAEIRATDANPSVLAAQHTLDGLMLTKSGQFRQGIPHLARAVRQELRARRYQHAVVTAQSIATTLRNAGEQRNSIRLLNRLHRRIRRRGHASPALLCRNHSMLALNTRDWGMRSQTLRHLELAVLYCERATDGVWTLATRIVLTLYRIEFNAARRPDREFIESIVDSECPSTLALLLDVGVQLTPCLFYFGMHEALDSLAERARVDLCPPESRAAFIIGVAYAMMSIDTPMRAIMESTGCHSIETLDAALAVRLGDATFEALRGLRPPSPQQEPNPAIVAYCIRTNTVPPRPQDLQLSGECIAKLTSARHPFFAGGDLALTLGLVPARACPLPVDVTSRAMIPTVRLPAALEWRRLLFLALRARRSGRFDRCARLVTNARSQASALLRTRLGRHLTQGRLQVDALFSEHFGPKHVQAPIARAPSILRAGSHRDRLALSPLIPPLWREALTAAEVGEPRLFVFSDAVQAELFTRVLVRSGVDCQTKSPCVAPPRPQHQTRVELHLVDVWAEDHLRAELLSLLGSGARRERTFATLTSTPLALAGRSPVGRALIELLGSKSIAVPDLLRDRGARRSTIEALWLLENPAAGELPDHVAIGLAEQPWPGGVPELRGALRQIARLGPSSAVSVPKTAEDWREQAGLDPVRVGPDGRILDFLGSVEDAAIRDIAVAAGLPLRTAQRRAGLLVKRGEVQRMGAGRAARYRRVRGRVELVT